MTSDEQPQTPEPTEQFSSEQAEAMIAEKTSALQEQVEALQTQLEAVKPPAPTPQEEDPFGPDWAPKTASDMGMGVLKAVEQKFPDMMQKQQEQVAEMVMQKMEEKRKQQEEAVRSEQDNKVAMQIDTIKDMDPEFQEKELWSWLKEYKGDDRPTSVPQAYRMYKEATSKKETEEQPVRIAGSTPNAEGVTQHQQLRPLTSEQAYAELLTEFGE